MPLIRAEVPARARPELNDGVGEDRPFVNRREAIRVSIRKALERVGVIDESCGRLDDE